MRIVFLFILLFVQIGNLFAQKYLKTQGTTKQQQEEYRRIDNMSVDSLKLGFSRNFEAYKSGGTLANLYLCNNYANELIKYNGTFTPEQFAKMRDVAEMKGDTLTEEYAITYAEEALYYFYRGKREKSQELNIFSFSRLKQLELINYTPMVNMVYKIAFIYDTMGETERSSHYAKVCIEEATKHKLNVFEAGGYLILAKNTLNYDPEISSAFSKKGLQIANRDVNETGHIKPLFFNVLTKLNAYLLKDYQAAIQYADSSLICDRDKRNNAEGMLDLLQCKAISHYNLKDDISLKDAFLHIDTLLNSDDIVNSSRYYVSLKSMGNTYYVIKDFRKAENYYREALKEYKSEGYPVDGYDLGGLYTDRGTMLVKVREFEKFDSLYKATNNFFTKGMPFDSLINAFDFVELKYLLKNYYNQISALCENNKKEISIDSVLDIYEKEFQLVKTIFNRFDFSSKTILTQTALLNGNKNNISKERILNRMTPAQKRRFWLLSSSLKNFELVNQKLIKNYSSNENSEFRRLRNRLARTDEKDSLYQDYFDDYISFCMDHYLNGLSRKENLFNLSNFDQSYRKAQKLLESESDNLILDFYQSDSIISICSISNGRMKYTAIPLDLKLKKDFTRLIRDVKALNYKSNRFYQQLSKYLAPIFDDAGKIRKIHIIADGELLMFPFELIEYKDRFLIESFDVSYNYSPYLLQESIENTRGNLEQILAIAPGFENSDNSIAQVLRDDIESLGESEDAAGMYRDNRDLAPLPYTKKEVQAINSILKKNNIKGKILLDNQATEQALRKDIRNYDIIHIATHGYSSKKEPGLSRLIFSSENEADVSAENNDSFLYLDEAYELPLNADLVVLSACKTGVGKIVEGEGVMALPRGFIYAGVPNVIASLWKVHDKKTKDLMVAFYRHLLEEKCSYSEALRMAKLDCISKGYLPIDWAGFILIGA
ncbi:MAG: CHAT domain-containing protein [Marinifilaceae bacterium]